MQWMIIGVSRAASASNTHDHALHDKRAFPFRIARLEGKSEDEQIDDRSQCDYEAGIESKSKEPTPSSSTL